MFVVISLWWSSVLQVFLMVPSAIFAEMQEAISILASGEPSNLLLKVIVAG
jgi:hypothetical protein